jgi:MFS family permease
MRVGAATSVRGAAPASASCSRSRALAATVPNGARTVVSDPTRLRAIGTGFGSAWLRAGSSIGPVLVGFVVAGVGIQFVFLVFAAIALFGGLVTARYAIETKGKVLEELSP